MKKILLVILFSLIPLYGGMRENAYFELSKTNIYIKTVEPKVKESGSPRALNLLKKAKGQIYRARMSFMKKNYRLCLVYVKEARELASFAVKVAIGRVRTKGGLIVCKNSLLYLLQREDVKKRYLKELKNARGSLDEAYSFYTKEEYKAALLKIKECIAIIRSIIGHISAMGDISEKAVKEKLKTLRRLVEKTESKEIILLYQRAEEEYLNGNYKLSLMLLNAIEKKLKTDSTNERLLIETMEKKILTELNTKKLEEKKRRKINLLLSEYKKSKQTGDYQKALAILKSIDKIISSE